VLGETRPYREIGKIGIYGYELRGIVIVALASTPFPFMVTTLLSFMKSLGLCRVSNNLLLSEYRGICMGVGRERRKAWWF
jgi:hypothetical protein